MPRVRLGAVLLVPEPQAVEIQGLRRALGDPVLDRIAPHVTLVPPVNVHVDALGDALSVLRRAAAGIRPFTLELGPPATFDPASTVLFLAVGGSPTALGALDALREAVFAPPLHRELDRPFVPHVTIAADLPRRRLDAAIESLGHYRTSVEVGSVHLLELRDTPAGKRWEPVADAPFERPAVVGRGGIELELTVSAIIDPEVLAALADELAAAGLPAVRADPLAVVPTDPPSVVVTDPPSVVVTARRYGQVVGVACDDVVVVRGSERRQGIGRQLRLAADARRPSA